METCSLALCTFKTKLLFLKNPHPFSSHLFIVAICKKTDRVGSSETQKEGFLEDGSLSLAYIIITVGVINNIKQVFSKPYFRLHPPRTHAPC